MNSERWKNGNPDNQRKNLNIRFGNGNKIFINVLVLVFATEIILYYSYSVATSNAKFRKLELAC